MSVQAELTSLDFELPAALAAGEPPEARGLARDAVRLLVSRIGDDSITHARFGDLPDFLKSSDLLVVNASATVNAALDAWREDGERIALHLSTPLPDGRWIVELRRVSDAGTAPLSDGQPGETLTLLDGASARMDESWRPGTQARLWIAALDFHGDVAAYAAEHGSPIRYKYVRRPWPLEFYQTVFATEPGSAEMPSAGRAFTREIVHRLARKGVEVAPIVLHTGVASLEYDEAPHPERYRVPEATADAVNRTRAAGGRIVAVGTTAVRALETVAAEDGRVSPGAGWTDLIVTPERGLFAVDAIVTGMHEARSSHLKMLEALAGCRHLALAYQAALRHRYLWHEFGDMHLIVPG
ncbi:MAG: S-adenosylmethionine:tRNA ribosyltransferase-isomerase [Gemmatimonadales bacterium]|nr:S-adenosylmethionine:tRNA ribosyltransferase-isomerase [Gemmatimonadales bacterium]MBA3553890.1 S-adenosylmethionine:tRNA ribosyltransferase-isomerase [Gemmatimonadales bacterium]